MALSNPKLLQTLPLLLSFTALFLEVHSQDTSFQIDTFPTNPSSQNLIYQGDAHVPVFPPGSSFLILAGIDSSGNPKNGSSGRVLYSLPVEFWEPGIQASFETTFTFFITPPSNNMAADGIAFFIAPFSPWGTAPPLFAAEFHFNSNSELEPNYPYIGININSRTVNTTRFDNELGHVVTVRINYDENTRRISVVATAGSQTSSLSYVFDLKTILPQQVQVGIEAATGQEVGVFVVFSWHFTSSLLLPENNGENEDMYMRKYLKKYV